MIKIKRGDIVGRKSYNKDILFVVDKIIKSSNSKCIVLLKGLTIRIQADSDIEDLELMDKQVIIESEKRLANRFNERIQRQEIKFKESKLTKRGGKVVYTGRILHLDGECIILEK